MYRLFQYLFGAASPLERHPFLVDWTTPTHSAPPQLKDSCWHEIAPLHQLPYMLTSCSATVPESVTFYFFVALRGSGPKWSAGSNSVFKFLLWKAPFIHTPIQDLRKITALRVCLCDCKALQCSIKSWKAELVPTFVHIFCIETHLCFPKHRGHFFSSRGKTLVSLMFIR